MKKIGILCCLFLMSCSVAKQPLSEEKVTALKGIVDGNKIHIISNSARPMATVGMQQLASANLLGNGNTASYIDLTTTANHFNVNGEQLSIYLPFYGEARSAGYSSDGGMIKFDGVPKKASSTFNDVKKRYELLYEFSNNNDYYKVRVEIYLNAKSRIHVISGNKSAISYSGVVQGV